MCLVHQVLPTARAVPGGHSARYKPRSMVFGFGDSTWPEPACHRRLAEKYNPASCACRPATLTPPPPAGVLDVLDDQATDWGRAWPSSLLTSKTSFGGLCMRIWIHSGLLGMRSRALFPEPDTTGLGCAANARCWWMTVSCWCLMEAHTTLVQPLIWLIPKTIGNRKRDCAWGCAWGINTTWENLQIEKHKSVRWAERTPSWFVLFDLQFFSGGVYSPSATSRTISFSISNSFWY